MLALNTGDDAMRYMRLAAVVATVLAVCGCQWKGGPGSQTQPASPTEIWKPEPLTMRVFPSSHFVKEGDQVALSARVELLDAMNDSIKWAGTFRFELYAATNAKNSTLGERLYAWNASVLSLEDQRQYYDPITRTYLFRLKLDDAATPLHDTVLRVGMTRSNGTRLETEAVLPATKLK